MNQSLNLKQIQLRFGVPQHVLIHLCEKGVISPDVADTAGRGRFRQFSLKNLFEFAVALELRKYQIPVMVIGAIIKLLGAFERAAQRMSPGFKIPESLAQDAPALDLWVFDGDLLVFQMAGKVKCSFSLEKMLEGDAKQVRLQKLKELPKDFQSCLQVDLSKLARNVLAA